MQNAPLDVVASVELSGNAQVFTGPCYITSIQISTNGTNDVIVQLYDGVDNTGKSILPNANGIVVKSTSLYADKTWQHPRSVTKGIYAVISGAGASIIVEYVPR